MNKAGGRVARMPKRLDGRLWARALDVAIGSLGVALVITIAVGSGHAAAAEVEQPRQMIRCMGLTANANDADPAGLNVRAAPGLDAPVLGTLKLRAFARDAMGRDLLQTPQFSITGSAHGWLLIEDIRYPDGMEDPALPASGWVHGSRVLVRSYDESAPTARLHSEPGSGGSSELLRGVNFSVLGCRDRWLHVREIDGPRQGWLAAPDVCAQQATRAQPVNPCTSR